MPLPTRVRLIVLFGGKSAEHDISKISASHVLRALDLARYEVVPVGITKQGSWILAQEASDLILQGRVSELPDSLLIDGPEVQPFEVLTGNSANSGNSRNSGNSGSEPASSTGLVGSDEDSLAPTVVLPILHGPNGEDGTVQGLLEMAQVPYVGSGVLGSAVAMDKAMAKAVLDAAGIAQPRWAALRVSDFRGEAQQSTVRSLLKELGNTVFVKPANMGSSIGISKASGDQEVIRALELAFEYDQIAVVEESVIARELEVAVLGNSSPRASVVGEIIPAADFYDYEDKYADGTAQSVIPADIPLAISTELRALAVQTFLSLRAEGMARVDVFFEEGTADQPGRGLLVNEINTIPGFTPISMYPMLWQATDLPYPNLIDELVLLAIERNALRAQNKTEVSQRATSESP
ncbi:MAG: D-alanine--D-alanine ligase family protein [Microthrixaceae bacterium]